MTESPHLLSPLTGGPLTVPNRIVTSAMHSRIETLDRPAERMAVFAAARTRGEAGLILSGRPSALPGRT